MCSSLPQAANTIVCDTALDILPADPLRAGILVPGTFFHALKGRVTEHSLNSEE